MATTFAGSIWIGGIEYSISESHSDMEVRHIGTVDYKLAEIKLSDSVHEQKKRETLLHEIMHVLDYVIGADERVAEAENVARSSGLFGILRDPRNRVTWGWIAGGNSEGPTDASDRSAG